MNLPIRSHEEFKVFFKEFFPGVLAFLEHYTRDTELARDLAQETFTRIYEKREETRDIEHAKAYLYTVARRLYLDHRKHQTVQEKFLAREKNAREPAEDHEFLAEVTRQETFRVLRSAIDKLSPRKKRVILASLQGKDNLEIATRLKISPSTVKSLKTKALADLRAVLSRDQLFLLLLLSGNCRGRGRGE
ncbi:MAG: sigma-70 family RNA polymerase sigma factor [Odoribacteraceae bacterium]|jgi:RNA polymerase sigma-70 factor (ECF subfamily)|nr:sigma-70 family RNA polymerase sigma factor [Odoribacteraceae bacterium]